MGLSLEAAKLAWEKAVKLAGGRKITARKREAAEEKAKRIVEEELRRLGWPRAELGRRRKGDLEEVRIARRLRAETTVTLKWVAAFLDMGT